MTIRKDVANSDNVVTKRFRPRTSLFVAPSHNLQEILIRADSYRVCALPLTHNTKSQIRSDEGAPTIPFAKLLSLVLLLHIIMEAWAIQLY